MLRKEIIESKVVISERFFKLIGSIVNNMGRITSRKRNTSIELCVQCSKC